MKRIVLVCAVLALGAYSVCAQVAYPAEELPPEVSEQLRALHAAQQPSVAMPLPPELFKTEEDRNAWYEFAEILKTYNEIYHRQPTGAEMVDALEHALSTLDAHSDIYDPEEGKELRDHINGQFVGVGMEIELTPGSDTSPKGIKVNPLPHQPADKAGLKAQDVLVEICNWDGEKNPATSAVFDNQGKERLPPKCHGTSSISAREAVKLLKGMPNTTVRVVIWRSGNDGPLTFDIHRDVIKINPVEDLKVQNGYGFMRLTTFSATTSKDTLDALEKLKAQNQGKKLDGLVLDLRGNTGGLLDQAMLMVSHFISDKQYGGNREAAIVLSEEKRGEVTPLANAMGARDVLGGAPILILVNGGSASASEIVAGVLQLHGRAIVAGVGHSFGKGSIQQIKTLVSGKVLRITTAQYLIGSRGCEKAIQGVGVQPDILLKPKQGELVATAGEKELEHSIPTSTVSSANCKYRFSVPAQDRVKALEMLSAFGLELAEPVKTQ